jgi:hypothetical protein
MVEATLMPNKSLSILRMNRNAPSIIEPEYRPIFFTGEGSRIVEQAATITGRKALKNYLVNRVYQNPT